MGEGDIEITQDWINLQDDWNKFYTEELRNLYSSRNIIKMTASKKISRVEIIAGMEEKTNLTEQSTWEEQRFLRSLSSGL